jgi:peroxidase
MLHRNWWQDWTSQTTRGKQRERCRSLPPGLELLEARCLLDGGFRTISGAFNNLDHPMWGAAGTDLLRVSPVAYADGISAPSTPNNLSPRVISNNLNNQSDPIFSGSDTLGVPQTKSLSDFAYVWGQFLDHDLDLTTTTSGQSFAIQADPRKFSGAVPDPNGTITDPMGTSPFTRSTFDQNTGVSTPRQQVNANTSYEDLSEVYGSTQIVADALRTFHGGLLKTSPGNLLPYNNLTYFNQTQLTALNMANDAHQVPDQNLFAAGDVRANENIELTAIQTLFVRNHNRIAGQLHDAHPGWSDELLYQEARKLNIAEGEMVTFGQFLSAIIGPNALPAYTGYNDDVNAGIATEFSTVGFRFGHTLLSNSVGRVNSDGTNIADVSPNGSAINLTADFFDPNLITPNGTTDPLTGHTSSSIGVIMKADASNTANELDLLLIDEIRNTLFGIPNGPGTDLAARDVQRARDHGIGTYNQVRVAYGLPAVDGFDDITSDVAVQAKLQATYGTVDKIDPFEGMLAEAHLPGVDVGPTLKAILVKQFTNLRNGDRFFYLNENFTSEELGILAQGNSLGKIIKNNTEITNLQDDVFFFKVSIEGRVFNADNGRGLANFTINLLDSSGAVISTTTTDANGHYSFTDQTGIPGTGNFRVMVMVPTGDHATTVTTHPIHLSRGGLDFDNQDFGIDLSGGL